MWKCLRVWKYAYLCFHADLIMEIKVSLQFCNERFSLCTEWKSTLIEASKWSHFSIKWEQQTSDCGLFIFTYWLEQVTNCSWNYSCNTDIEDTFDSVQMTYNGSTLPHFPHHSNSDMWHALETLKHMRLGSLNLISFMIARYFVYYWLQTWLCRVCN